MTQRRASVLVALVLATLLLVSCTKQPDLVSDRSVEALPDNGWTLLVREDGPRWLSPAWWRDRGVDPQTLSSAGIQITRGDSVVPYAVLESPEGPGLLFVGETVPGNLSSSMTVGPVGGYSLVLGTSGQPADVAESMVDGAPDVCQGVTEARLTLGEDAVFRSTAPLDPPWLWYGLRPVDGITVTLTLTDVVPGEPVTVTTTAWGQSSMPQDPDHHLRLVWNGTNIGDHMWDGSGIETWAATTLAGQSPEVSLGLVAPGGTQAPVELTWLDAAEVTWQQRMVASSERWQSWRADGAQAACLALARSDADAQFVGVLRGNDGAIRYAAPRVDTEAGRLYVPQEPGDFGWVGLPWAAPPPDLVRPRQVLDRDEVAAAQYLIIAPSQFHDALAPMLEARRLQGLTVAVVTPDAVYDAYGSGVPSASSIQALVSDFAGSGSGRLAFLLLVGDASASPTAIWDPEVVTLPTIWVDTAHVGATASDYAIATGGGDVPLVSVGRFPVTEIDELETLVKKTLSWESNDRLLLISDDEPAFADLTDKLGEIAAPDLVVDAAVEDARDAVLSWLEGGPGTLVYTGHGSMGLLGDEKLLLLEDGENWRQPTVVAAWSCLCASFAHPTYASLSEAWLLAPRGVVAVVGPTGETTTAEQTAMALALQTSLSDGEVLGQALLSAWRASQSENTKNGFVLLGDPYLQPMLGQPDGADGDG